MLDKGVKHKPTQMELTAILRESLLCQPVPDNFPFGEHLGATRIKARFTLAAAAQHSLPPRAPRERR